MVGVPSKFGVSGLRETDRMPQTRLGVLACVAWCQGVGGTAQNEVT